MFAAQAAFAQTEVVKRVRLTTAKSAILTGTLPKGDMTHVYLLRAAKDQGLKVDISFTGRGDAEFSLKRPDGENIDENNIILGDWEGILPQAGDYKIIVFNPSQIRGVTRYVLKISLPK